MLNRWMKTGGDESGHVGERNRGDEEVWVSVMLRKNAERQMVANLAKWMEMAVMNTEVWT